MKSLFLLPLLAFVALPAQVATPPVREFVALKNPFLNGADPHVTVVGDTVWLYPTDGTHRIGSAFWAFSSKDLRNWKEYGPILKFDEIPWIAADGRGWHGAWAPAMLQKGNRYYLYYSVGPQDNEHPSRLGVATADSPAGPFKDSGKALLTGGNGFEAIDPMAFTDPKSGKTYLYCGGSAGAKLRVFEMAPDMVSFAREVPVDTPTNFTEGVFMHYRAGQYYLSYSHGGWRDSSYSAYYAMSRSPIGPWRYMGPILTSDGTHKGPGHHAIFKSPGKDQWYIAYHRWDNQSGNGPYNGSREICIDRLSYTPDGAIEPVKMTDQAPLWEK